MPVPRVVDELELPLPVLIPLVPLWPDMLPLRFSPVVLPLDEPPPVLPAAAGPPAVEEPPAELPAPDPPCARATELTELTEVRTKANATEASFIGCLLYRMKLSRGIDERPVRANRIRKSVGAENTFDRSNRIRRHRGRTRTVD
jgi:hypothetical protein